MFPCFHMIPPRQLQAEETGMRHGEVLISRTPAGDRNGGAQQLRNGESRIMEDGIYLCAKGFGWST